MFASNAPSSCSAGGGAVGRGDRDDAAGLAKLRVLNRLRQLLHLGEAVGVRERVIRSPSNCFASFSPMSFATARILGDRFVEFRARTVLGAVGAVRQQLAERAAVFGVLRIELLRLAQRGDRAVDVAAFAKKAAEEVVLEDAGKRELRVRVRRLERDGAADLFARRVAEAADEQRAGDLDVMLRLFRMQRGQLAELGQRAGDVAGVQLGLADRDRSR